MADIFTDLRLTAIENVRAFVRSNYALFAALDEFGISTTYLAELLQKRGIKIQAATLRKYITECARDPKLTVDADQKKHHLQSLQNLLLRDPPGDPKAGHPAPRPTNLSSPAPALPVDAAPGGAEPPHPENPGRRRPVGATPSGKLTEAELAQKYNTY